MKCAGCGSEKLANDICEIAFKLGYVLSIKEVFYKGMKNKHWRLNLQKQKDGFERIFEKHAGTWKEIEYKDFV